MGGGRGRHNERGEHQTLAVSTPLSGAVIEGQGNGNMRAGAPTIAPAPRRSSAVVWAYRVAVETRKERTKFNLLWPKSI
jgi:hypothetical protein